jgi:beta-glucosidase
VSDEKEEPRMTTFPEGFLWGAATAGHQVEGGNVNADLWPLEWVENSTFVDPSGDACDHYHRYPEDIERLAALGCNAYRFSLEWSRIEPEPGYFSRAALDHYRCDHETFRRTVKPSAKWLGRVARANQLS